MSYAPIFEAVNVSAVQSLLKAPGGELRFYLFGRAPQNVVKPYAVWRTVFGSPENYLGDRPDVDFFGLQIDVYAAPTALGATQSRDIAMAIRDAIETKSHITSWRGESVDPETGSYVYSFDSEWFVKR